MNLQLSYKQKIEANREYIDEIFKFYKGMSMLMSVVNLLQDNSSKSYQNCIKDV